MLCPQCLKDVKFNYAPAEGADTLRPYLCPTDRCGERVERTYVDEYHEAPIVPVCAVGLPRHGKTTYFAALMYFARRFDISRGWPNFFLQPVNREAVEATSPLAEAFGRGELPDATPKVFPRPSLIRLAGVPGRPERECRLLCYDPAGEVYENATSIDRFARFVQLAKAVVFFISLKEVREEARYERTSVAAAMDRLFDNYDYYIRNKGVKRRSQDLIVVYTRADELLDDFETRPSRALGSRERFTITSYLRMGATEGLAPLKTSRDQRGSVSAILRKFTETDLEARNFVRMAEDSYRSLTFTVTSALGCLPIMADGDRRLLVAPVPKRVLDPILWVVEKTLDQRRWWQ